MTCIEEVPVFADGGWSDVEQIEVPCLDPIEPDDCCDYPDFDVPYVDFDPVRPRSY